MERTEKQIRDFIRKAAGNYSPDPTTALFVERFREIYGANLRAVIYYGSRLVEGLAKPSSFRDFFLLVDDYSPISRGLFDKITLPLMPPNMWFLAVDEGGTKQESKYHLLTVAEFRRYCSRHAPDHYVIGRMSKRVALAWAADASTRAILLDCLGDAFINNAVRAAPLLDVPSLFNETVKHFLAMSYRCEVRMETPDKIEQLYNAGMEFYEPLYSMLFDLLVADGALVKNGTHYIASPAELRRAFRARRYILKSKLRHVARFPLMIRNMSNWLDQLLGKYERTFGKPLELTDFERRHLAWTAVKYIPKIMIAKRP